MTPECGVQLDTHLTLVIFGAAVEMEEAVAVAAQVSARVADDDGDGLSVVVVVAGRPRGRVGRRAGRSAVPLAGGEALHVVLVEDAEGGEGEPEDGVAHAF